jgi:hypothetical protein
VETTDPQVILYDFACGWVNRAALIMAMTPLEPFSQHLASDHSENSHMSRLKRLYGYAVTPRFASGTSLELLKRLSASPDEVTSAMIKADRAIEWSDPVSTSLLPVPVPWGLSSLPETYTCADRDHLLHADCPCLQRFADRTRIRSVVMVHPPDKAVSREALIW